MCATRFSLIWRAGAKVDAVGEHEHRDQQGEPFCSHDVETVMPGSAADQSGGGGYLSAAGITSKLGPLASGWWLLAKAWTRL